jgi:hypothetical protein
MPPVAPPPLVSEPDLDESESIEPCPPTYKIRSMFALFIFLPLGILAVDRSRQVERKYAKQDIEGAILASRQAKSLFIWSVGFGLGTIAIVSSVTFAAIWLIANTPSKPVIAPTLEEAIARKYLESAIAAEIKAVKTRSDRKFIPTLEALKLLAPERSYYHFQGKLTIDPQTKLQKFVIIAYPTVDGVLKGYSAIVYEVDGTKSLNGGICATAAPTRDAIVPQIEIIDGKVNCGSGATSLPIGQKP